MQPKAVGNNRVSRAARVCAPAMRPLAAFRWLASGDTSRLAGFGVFAGTSTLGLALGFRQAHLKSSPIMEAASEQLRSAEAVAAFLGGAVASVDGVVGGYTDPVGGTSVLTIPIVTLDGVHAVARVEAEAEWVGEQAAAEARGEEFVLSPNAKAADCRWMLRHLEVERGDGDGGDGAEPAPLVLYSVPAKVPLSCWAPRRKPSSLMSLFPRWMRALLPEPSGFARDPSVPRLVGIAGLAIALHSFAFVVLRRRIAVHRAPDTPVQPAGSHLRAARTCLGLYPSLSLSYPPPPPPPRRRPRRWTGWRTY